MTNIIPGDNNSWKISLFCYNGERYLRWIIMGKKKFEARGFADEWKVRRDKKVAKEAKREALKKAQHKAEKAAAAKAAAEKAE